MKKPIPERAKIILYAFAGEEEEHKALRYFWIVPSVATVDYIRYSAEQLVKNTEGIEEVWLVDGRHYCGKWSCGSIHPKTRVRLY